LRKKIENDNERGKGNFDTPDQRKEESINTQPKLPLTKPVFESLIPDQSKKRGDLIEQTYEDSPLFDQIYQFLRDQGGEVHLTSIFEEFDPTQENTEEINWVITELQKQSRIAKSRMTPEFTAVVEEKEDESDD
jgi:hypothetical protein